MASKKLPKRRSASTEVNRENQMVSLATDLAEKQLSDGTASAMVITHYLKLGSTREKLEQERLRRENEVLNARVETLASAKKVEELYSAALDAMRSYAGRVVDSERDYYDED